MMNRDDAEGGTDAEGGVGDGVGDCDGDDRDTCVTDIYRYMHMHLSFYATSHQRPGGPPPKPPGPPPNIPPS